MIDPHSLNILGRIGRLLDEAVDLADNAGETLLAAQIAQTLHVLDGRIDRLRGESATPLKGSADPRAIEE